MNTPSLSRRALAVAAATLVAGGSLLALPASAQAVKEGGTLVIGTPQAPRHLVVRTSRTRPSGPHTSAPTHTTGLCMASRVARQWRAQSPRRSPAWVRLAG